MIGRALRWATVGLLAGAVVLSPAPAAADAVSPAGSCFGTASWRDGGFSEDTRQLIPDDVIVVDRTDEVAWSGTVVGPTAGTPRPVDGRISLALPPLFGSIELGKWSGQGTAVEKSGTYRYDLPDYVPAGVELDLFARHSEGAAEHCYGAVGIMIEGGPFDSPIIWGVLAGVLITAGLLALIGRRPAGGAGFGRLLAGGVVGLLFGFFVALALVLFGILPLASVVVTILFALGLVLGAVWGRWAPIGGRSPVTPE